MKCSHCNVTIGCRTPVCPLCHAPFSKTDGTLAEAKKLPRAFPVRSKAPLFGTSRFDKIYFLVAVNIILTALIAEYVVARSFNWVWVVAAGLFYLYLLIRGTIQDAKYFSEKVVMQTIVLSVLAFTLQSIIPRPLMVFEFILPILYLISLIMIAIYTLTRIKSYRRHLMNLLSIALLSFLPFLVIIASKEEAPNFILSVITASFGGVIILTSLLFSARKIFYEIKRIFHI